MKLGRKTRQPPESSGAADRTNDPSGVAEPILADTCTAIGPKSGTKRRLRSAHVIGHYYRSTDVYQVKTETRLIELRAFAHGLGIRSRSDLAALRTGIARGAKAPVSGFNLRITLELLELAEARGDLDGGDAN